MKPKALILGMGCSGRAAAKLALSKGYEVTGVDKNHTALKKDPAFCPQLLNEIDLFSEEEPLDLRLFSLLIVSPGVSSQHPLLKAAAELPIEILSEIAFAAKELKDVRILGVTGTNGKTTVTLLTTHVLTQLGIPAKAVGNVGTALSQVVEEGLKNEVLVLELSSYQLETPCAPLLDAAVILNITPDHLERHGSMEVYASTKFSIHANLKPGAPLFIQSQVAQEFQQLLPKAPFQTFRADDYQEENQQAAFHLCSALGVSPEEFAQGMRGFQTPPHRVEFVRRWRSIDFYNDSKGTNVDAVLKAVSRFSGPILLIAGGVDKKASYLPWIELFKGRVKGIFAIGEAASKILAEIGNIFPVFCVESLEKAIHTAAAAAVPGDTVLLSPGCASFDMFKDYAHRGDMFKEIVFKLPNLEELREES